MPGLTLFVLITLICLILLMSLGGLYFPVGSREVGSGSWGGKEWKDLGGVREEFKKKKKEKSSC